MNKDPMELASCRGKDPQLFDTFLNPLPALRICDTCPVRSWCLATVDPARSYYDGVAGGHTWREGMLKCSSCVKTDPILINYLRRIGAIRRYQDKAPEADSQNSQ